MDRLIQSITLVPPDGSLAEVGSQKSCVVWPET